MRLIPIDDPADPRLAPYTGLRDHDLRQKRERRGGDFAGIFVAEGSLVVARAVTAGYRLASVLLPYGRSERPLPFPVADDVPVYVAEGRLAATVTGLGVVRDVLAVLHRRPLVPLWWLVAASRRLLLLEGVANPTNLGVIVRSAAGLGFDGFLLDPSCCDPLYRRASRAAMGEVFALPYGWLGRFPGSWAPLREHGYTIVALTPDDAAEPIRALRLPRDGKVALLLGAEGPGLTGESLAAADRRVRIPMHRGVDSLNVGAAAAVACYAVEGASG